MKKFRGIWLAVLTVILSVAMLMGTMTVSAFADEPTTDPAPAEPTTTATAFNMAKTVEYGKTATVPAGATVTAPNGQVATVTDNKFTADQIGVYTVNYNGYTYVISSKLDEEYELRVEQNGAKVPTYVATNKEVTLPTAMLVKKSDLNGVDYEKVNATVDITVTPSVTVTDRKVTFTAPGTYTVRYSCNVNGGKKYLFKDYTVNVQNNFKDEVKPVLNVVNIPTTISLNTKYTLPKATATDNYDKNVQIAVKVEEFVDNNWVAVKAYEVDDNGYATDKAFAGNSAYVDNGNVVFDTEHNLAFWPTKETKYKITYTATDDSGNVAASIHEYTTEAKDRTAPLLVNIDDEQIPSTWGITEVNNGDDAADLTSKNIVFPYPEYVDNSDDKFTVYFELQDPDKKTVVKFTNIYDYAENGTAQSGAKFTANSGNGGYPDACEFTKNGLTLDLAKYKVDNKTPTGTYTVTYRARDSKANSASKTYDITLEDKFTDSDKPDVTVSFNDKFLVFGAGEEFTVPTPVVSDDTDSRPQVTYTLFDGDATTGLEVKGGEVAKLDVKDNKPCLVTDDGELVFNGNTLRYLVVAKDDAGNDEKAEGTVAVVNAQSGLDFGAYTPDIDTTNKLPQGAMHSVGGFEFAVAEANREFFGFELSLAKDGEAYTSGNMLVETYYDAGKVVVKDIRFAAPKAENVTLFVRIFNIAGVSQVYSYDFKVEGGNEDGDTISAANIGTSGNVYTTYTLQNGSVKTPADIADGKHYIVRKIEGKGKFSLMGTQFTAYNAGSFTFTDGYYSNNGFVQLATNGKYTVTVTENATPVWQLQSAMPSYSKVYEKVTLPYVVASTDYANAKIEVAVQDPDSESLTVANEKLTLEDGVYSFTPSKNGTYNVTYTAYYGDSDKITQSYAIKVGDVVAPTFDVGTGYATRATENDKFVFRAVNVTSDGDKDTDKGSVVYKKTLKAPDGSEVYTVSGTGETYRTMTHKTDDTDGYTFTKTGTYTVEYTVTDKVGNSSVFSYTITVGAAKVNNPISTKIISTILIIVGVLLIAGVILYFVRFRKVKSK